MPRLTRPALTLYAVAGCYLLGLVGRIYAGDWPGSGERAAGCIWAVALAWRITR